MSCVIKNSKERGIAIKSLPRFQFGGKGGLALGGAAPETRFETPIELEAPLDTDTLLFTSNPIQGPKRVHSPQILPRGPTALEEFSLAKK